MGSGSASNCSGSATRGFEIAAFYKVTEWSDLGVLKASRVNSVPIANEQFLNLRNKFS